MEEITPPFYANEEIVSEYTLRGAGFSSIPEDAVGLYSSDNANPLERLNTDSQSLLFSVVVDDDTTLRAICMQPSKHYRDNYLGAIVSADRQHVYWVNDAEPLP